jgi:hypothetical protein
MQEQASDLPQQFRDLGEFLGDWGELTTQDERYLRRQSLPMPRLLAFHQAAAPRLPAILDHLDSHPFGIPLPRGEELLRRLALAMAEAAQAVEVYGEPGIARVRPGHSVPMRTLGRF